MKRRSSTLGWVVLLTAIGTPTAAAAAPLRAAAVAPSKTTVSSDWAGYVARRTSSSGAPISFSTVSGRWVLPEANCSSTSIIGPTSAAFWVGLGGDQSGSNPVIEQIGTVADCSATGAPDYFAWYELVPAGWVKVRLNVSPGDTISAAVSVSGTRVTVLMRNVTRKTSFSKTLTIASPDSTSAEWIVEPPSVCTSVSGAFCGRQMLTNFGTVRFSDMIARSPTRRGSVRDPSWSETPVSLHEGGPYGGFAPEQNAAEAVPSTLSRNGSAFSISWRRRSGM